MNSKTLHMVNKKYNKYARLFLQGRKITSVQEGGEEILGGGGGQLVISLAS